MRTSDFNMDDKTQHSTIRIGTRRSPLAMVQAEMVQAALFAAHPQINFEIVPMISQADWKPAEGEKPLSENLGGKGQFASEIEDAIVTGRVDCGVHSLKDMSSFLPETLEINHYLPRADARDVLISVKHNTIKDLSAGCVVGTCSLRRSSLLLSHNPDIKIVPFRGNVQTRLDKLYEGQVDATLLAKAGLDRLGIHIDHARVIEPEDMLPACGQGIVCIETRKGDVRVQGIMAAINCEKTAYCAVAEREILKILDGSCHTPIGAYAIMDGGMLYLRALVASQDGQIIFRQEHRGAVHSSEEARAIGQIVGQRLKQDVPQDMLE